CQHHYGSPPTF
nr:immunoglobulin light chain junction region [Macaca mulatta]